MPNAITSQTFVDGNRVTEVKYNIVGDGSGEETKTVLYDASTFTAQAIDNAVTSIEYCLVGFSAQLYWDASTDVPLLSLAEGSESREHFNYVGSIANNSGTGKTGDILISTSGLGSGDHGFIILRIKQK